MGNAGQHSQRRAADRALTAELLPGATLTPSKDVVDRAGSRWVDHDTHFNYDYHDGTTLLLTTLTHVLLQAKDRRGRAQH